jgi:hypothetical protein
MASAGGDAIDGAGAVGFGVEGAALVDVGYGFLDLGGCRFNSFSGGLGNSFFARGCEFHGECLLTETAEEGEKW